MSGKARLAEAYNNMQKIYVQYSSPQGDTQKNMELLLDRMYLVLEELVEEALNAK